jgi:hypothetical protein
LVVDLLALCRRAGITQRIRLAESNAVAAPSVWGIFRPTIILPREIASSLTAEQLRWVLAHELAHIQRRDLLVVVVQRFATILHFFNPAIWIANRVIHQLREYACDDRALVLSQTSAVESGEAFVHLLRRAGRARSELQGALGVFGLGSRASCIGRVLRLLDTDRTIHSAPGARWVLALVLLAFVAVPHLRAAGEGPQTASVRPEKDPNGTTPAVAKATGAGARDVQPFELRVVGPRGKAVPIALVEMRTRPVPVAGQIRRGTFVKEVSCGGQGPCGAEVMTDTEGRLALDIPTASPHFDIFITIPGYGPYWAGWSSEVHADPIPPQFTAELEPAWSVGGIVVDAAGKAVEGVRVNPSIEFKKRPEVTRQLGVGTALTTDAKGKWRFDSVPASLGEVHVEIDHAGFMPIRRFLTRREFGIERGQEAAAKLTLEHGLTITGKVTDDAGTPIAGALVRTKFLNEIREARSGGDGVYRLVGCEPRSARIVVSAKGRATDMKELTVEPGMRPVDFALKPGGTVRIRVLDERGNAIPKARIFFQQWRGRFEYFEFDHISQYADSNGRWIWHEAPVDEFKADICPAGDGMQLLVQPLIARREEYVFRLPAPLVISGKVVDAETREPIKRFRVVPGVRSSADHMNWIHSESFVVIGGGYRLQRSRGDFAHMVRVEADGYHGAVSRDIKSDEGRVSIDFALKRGTNVVAKIVTPRNRPAAGARIALGVGGSQINIKNGEIEDHSTYCARETADDAGRFHFPAQDTEFQLVITHPSGFAHIKSPADWDLARIIRLEPWARVEGTFRVGKRAVGNVPISLNVFSGPHSYGPGVPSIFTQHQATSGSDGRFMFERVIPGRGRIGRGITLLVNDGATEVTSSCEIVADFPAGKLVQIDLGGSGRPVVGRLRPPKDFAGKVRWNFALVNAGSENLDARATSPHLTATVDRDGKFRIDDVPSGRYSLDVYFQQDAPGHLRNHRFQVPARDGAAEGELVDLGTLTLEKR